MTFNFNTFVWKPIRAICFSIKQDLRFQDRSFDAKLLFDLELLLEAELLLEVELLLDLELLLEFEVLI